MRQSRVRNGDMRFDFRRNTRYRTLRWLGVFTGLVVGQFMLFYKLMAGIEHYTIKIKLIPGILFCILVMAFLIFRRPWK